MAHSLLHRLFHLGAVGMMSDAQLLDRFISRRDEAAFEELVNRHGPMVLRVCRGVLGDDHDAEDAFQAVFLVLARRGLMIRRRESLASWLFGVAHRVSTRARRSLARRRRHEAQAALNGSAESEPIRDENLDLVALHQEIDRLPERLRTPVVLCYFQGLTCAAAALQVGTSEAALRGRLARARERLRRRLSRRGVAVPAILLAAGAVGNAHALVPSALIRSTIQIAAGFPVGHAAAVLARGELHSMLYRVLTVNLVAGIAGLSALGLALVKLADEGKDQPRPVQAASAKSQPAQPPTGYRLTGSVRVEGTGEPIAGAKFLVLLGNADQKKQVRSGPDGQFDVELPPGQARSWTVLPPPGYWMPNNVEATETFVLSPDHRVHRKDYLVRRGVVWPFRLTRGAARRPVPGGCVGGSAQKAYFLVEADETGLARLTLPPGGGQITLFASPKTSSRDGLKITVERDAGFRPDAVAKMDHRDGRIFLADADGKTATLTGLERFEPSIAGGKLEVRVDLPEPDFRTEATLTGRVVDEHDHPIPGAKIAMAYGVPSKGSAMSGDPSHEVTTDADGVYTIQSVPRRDPNSKPWHVFVVATKDGYAGGDSPAVELAAGTDESPRVLAPIRLAPGFALKGRVVDPQGRPVVGAWVDVRGSYALHAQATRTDEQGRFRVANLPRGLARLYFEYGPMYAMGKYLADGKDDDLDIRLRPTAEALEQPKTKTPEPPALGTLAPALEVSGWTDGKTRTLADYRGKVVLLDFWGIWCGACTNGMPALEKLKQKYEPRGVVFLSIHTPGEDMGRIRRFLEFKKSSFISALDESRGKPDNSYNGVTADRYGVRDYPTLVMIDREGKIAFHSGIGTKEGVAAMKALGKEMGVAEKDMTPESFYRVWDAYFSREIERVLDRP